MKKGTVWIIVGIVLIVVAFFMDALLYPDGMTMPDWQMQHWIIFAVVLVILIAGIVMIVIGCRQRKKEKKQQGQAI